MLEQGEHFSNSSFLALFLPESWACWAFLSSSFISMYSKVVESDLLYRQTDRQTDMIQSWGIKCNYNYKLSKKNRRSYCFIFLQWEVISQTKPFSSGFTSLPLQEGISNLHYAVENRTLWWWLTYFSCWKCFQTTVEYNTQFSLFPNHCCHFLQYTLHTVSVLHWWS